MEGTCYDVQDVFIYTVIQRYHYWQADTRKLNFSTGINISGTVISTGACSFNKTELDINFGDVYIADLVGDSNRKDIGYTLSCTGDYAYSDIQLHISGTVSSSDRSLLATNVPGVGIKLFRDNIQLKPDEIISLGDDPSIAPKLRAAVVIGDADVSKLNGVRFFTSATLTVAFN